MSGWSPEVPEAWRHIHPLLLHLLYRPYPGSDPDLVGLGLFKIKGLDPATLNVVEKTHY